MQLETECGVSLHVDGLARIDISRGADNDGVLPNLESVVAGCFAPGLAVNRDIRTTYI